MLNQGQSLKRFLAFRLKCNERYIIVLTKTTATQNEAALSYHRVRGLHFQADVFEVTIIVSNKSHIFIRNTEHETDCASKQYCRMQSAIYNKIEINDEKYA